MSINIHLFQGSVHFLITVSGLSGLPSCLHGNMTFFSVFPNMAAGSDFRAICVGMHSSRGIGGET